MHLILFSSTNTCCHISNSWKVSYEGIRISSSAARGWHKAKISSVSVSGTWSAFLNKDKSMWFMFALESPGLSSPLGAFQTNLYACVCVCVCLCVYQLKSRVCLRINHPTIFTQSFQRYPNLALSSSGGPVSGLSQSLHIFSGSLKIHLTKKNLMSPSHCSIMSSLCNLSPLLAINCSHTNAFDIAP